MPEITEAEYRKTLEAVGQANRIEVVFPWGFRIVTFDGRKVLQPLTPEEYRAAAAEDPGKIITDIEIAGRPRCECKLTNAATVVPRCTEAGGGWCSYHYSKGRWYSVCNYL